MSENQVTHVCVVCGYVHEEHSEVAFDDMPSDYLCPECGVEKDFFETVEF